MQYNKMKHHILTYISKRGIIILQYEINAAKGGDRMKAIQKYRELAGMTQAMLAEKIGVTQSTISNWECGERKPDIYALKKIAYALSCTTDELLAYVNVHMNDGKDKEESE